MQNYSERNAFIGSTVDAFHAGYKLAAMLTIIAIAIAMTTIVGVTIGVKDIDELDALLELCVPLEKAAAPPPLLKLPPPPTAGPPNPLLVCAPLLLAPALLNKTLRINIYLSQLIAYIYCGCTAYI